MLDAEGAMARPAAGLLLWAQLCRASSASAVDGEGKVKSKEREQRASVRKVSFTPNLKFVIGSVFGETQIVLSTDSVT